MSVPVIDTVRASEPLVRGRSKTIWALGDGTCLIELVPSLSSFTHGRHELAPGTDVLRLDFFELAVAELRTAGLDHAFVRRVGPTSYVARLCTEPPFEVIAKNAALGSTTRKYPGLFPEGHRFDPPVVKFDFRVDPEDQPIGEDYVRAAGWPADEMRAIALRTNEILRGWLAPRDLLDFCIIVGRDANDTLTVVSEISPDCMRLRGSNGEKLDKDLFREGASQEEILATWSTLIEGLKQESAPSC